MCHLSPAVHLSWALLSFGLQLFLIQHLWRYDKFKCLAWSSGKQPGTFKRVMTYSYLLSVPCLVLYSVTMAVLKYRNGYTQVPEHGIVPTPYFLWPQSDQRWLSPLYIVFGCVWGLELVTHLEELTFWLFLLHQGPDKRDWFHSPEFKTWAMGSCIAMVGLPVTAVLTRANPLKAEAYIFLVGAAASFVVTVFFFVVLAKFPNFLRQVKKEGAATAVVLRLVKFHELNILRVIFRLLMGVPLLILGVDGVMTHHVINSNPLWTDLLAFLAAVGTVVSSTMTLLIFFPRSLAEDSNWRPQTTEDSRSSLVLPGSTSDNTKYQRSFSPNSRGGVPTSQVRRYEASSPFQDASEDPAMSLNTIPYKPRITRNYTGLATPSSILNSPYRPPSYFKDSDDNEMIDEGEGGPERERQYLSESEDPPKNTRITTKSTSSKGHPRRDTKVRMIELGETIDAGLQKPQRPPRLHPYITSFTSPIDLLEPDVTMPHAV